MPGGNLAILMGDYCNRDAGFAPLTYYTRQLAFTAGLAKTTPFLLQLFGDGDGRRFRALVGLHPRVPWTNAALADFQSAMMRIVRQLWMARRDRDNVCNNRIDSEPTQHHSQHRGNRGDRAHLYFPFAAK